MRNKGVRILISSSWIVSKTVVGWWQWYSNLVWQFHGSVAFFLICKKNYKGKSVVRVNTRYRIYFAQNQRKICAKVGKGLITEEKRFILCLVGNLITSSGKKQLKSQHSICQDSISLMSDLFILKVILSFWLPGKEKALFGQRGLKEPGQWKIDLSMMSHQIHSSY